MLSEIILPWTNTYRIVCKNSYFASVPASEELWKHGIHFIVVIKTATWKFPMEYLSNIELHNWGYMSRLLTGPVYMMEPVLGDFFGMDRNRRYFIFTGGLMDKG